MTDLELDQLLGTWQPAEPPERLRERIFASVPRRGPRVGLRWLAVAAACALAVLLGFLAVGPVQIGSSLSSLADGTHLRTTTYIEPGMEQPKWSSRLGGWGSFGPDRVRRYVIDRNAQTYVGYTLLIEPEGPGAWRFTVEPATTPPGDGVETGSAHYRQIALPSIAPPRLVRLGEAFDIDLIVTPGRSLRVFDRLELSAEKFELVLPPPPPRYIGSEMRFNHPRLTLDGAYIGEASLDARGYALWLVVPGYGSFYLAVEPDGNPGFVQAGTVDGKTLDFVWAGHRFHVEADQAIASATPRPVFVFHGAEDGSGARELTFGSAGPASQIRR